MPSLTVWRYQSAMGAEVGEVCLKSLQERGAVTIQDAITVTWVRGAERPHIGHLRRRTAAAVKGSLLGGLLGMVVLPPPAGAAGRPAAAAAQRLTGTGIDQDLLQRIREVLVPGTSALLVLSSDADLDVVAPVLSWGHPSLVHAELSDDVGDALRALLDSVDEDDSEDPPPP